MRLCDARQREKMCDDLSQTAVSKTMLCVYERKIPMMIMMVAMIIMMVLMMMMTTREDVRI